MHNSLGGSPETSPLDHQATYVIHDNISIRRSQKEILKKNQKIKFPKNSPKIGENRGIIGDGDKLEIGEFFGKVPQNSTKIGVGMGKTFSGNIGDQLGMGID